MASLTVRPIEAADRPAWERLWAAYLDFYEQSLPAPVTEDVWQRLLARDSELMGFVAVEREGEGPPVGFVHALPHQNTWRIEPVVYLEDLFVDPSIRGQGAGGALVAAVAAAAKALGASLVYWQTDSGNETAQRLYDKIAERKRWVRYDMPI